MIQTSYSLLRKSAIFIFLAVFLTIFFGKTAFAEAFDSIAGFETLLKVSDLRPAEIVYARLIAPQGERKVFTSEASRSGEAKFEIPSEDLRKAGRYRVEYISKAQGGVISEEEFVVYPDSPSPDVSGIYPFTDRALANGRPVQINIRLQDQYGNPIEGHDVLLTSSRSNDQLSRSSEVTNDQGNILFALRSVEPGVSVLTAHDQTEKMTFNKRAGVTFISARNQSARSRAGQFGAASILDGFGGDDDTSSSNFLALADVTSLASARAARFEIKDLKASPFVNENLSFKVKVVDQNDGLVTDYAKTIEFESTDPNATFPEDYTFQPADLGEHAFELSISFSATGRQKLIVQEKDKPEIKGEIDVDVKPARAVAGSGLVTITKPTPGRYGTKDIDLGGQAPPNANVNMYDNGQQVGVTRASANGVFTFTATNLADGQHAFTAEANGILSQEVVITVAASAAMVEELKLIPNPVGPNLKVEVQLKSQPELETVSLTVADTIITLAPHPTDLGAYVGNFNAPARPGSFPVDAQLVDRQGVEASYVEVQTLVVDEKLGTGVAFRVPSRVTGVRAHGGPGRVTLAWEPSTDDTGIARYRIYYGFDRNNLDQVVETADARTTWYVANLEEGVTYFFQLAGVDTEGNEADQKSAVVGAVAAPGGAGFLPGGEFLPYPIGLPEDGPGIAWLFFLAPGLASVGRFLRKKMK